MPVNLHYLSVKKNSDSSRHISYIQTAFTNGCEIKTPVKFKTISLGIFRHIFQLPIYMLLLQM